MSIWFFIWFSFAALMAGVTLWSTYILMQQKDAWKKFALDKKINYKPGQFFSPCEMDGTIDGFAVSFFTGTQQDPDARKNRQLTIFEITDTRSYVDGLACGSPEMKSFLDMLDALSRHGVESANWDNKHTMFSRNKKSVDAYLTDTRLKIMNEMLKFPKSDVIIIMDKNQAVYRFETVNPLTDAKMIDDMLQKLFSRIKKLRPSEDDYKKYQALRDTEEDKDSFIQEKAQEPISDSEAQPLTETVNKEDDKKEEPKA